MSWSLTAQVASDLLAVALVARLLALGLHSVYRVFCYFLIVEVLASSFVIVQTLAGGFSFVDYRVSWMVMRLVIWVFYLWMVYALMGAILSKLPGILRFARRVLNFTFFVAIVAALLTAMPEYKLAGSCVGCTGIERAVTVAFVLERVISMVALLAILAILAFIVAFPVKLPRNLVLFTVGYLAYFGVKIGILLARDLWSASSVALSIISMSVMSACFLYWLLTLTAAGERSPFTLGNVWRTGDHARALHALESMNVALLRAARR